jgi:hypothetical protein
LLLGALLVLRPQTFATLNRLANQWVSLRHVNRLLDKTISIERWFYRHHRVMGIVIMLGAIYFLVYFFWHYDKARLLLSLSPYLATPLLEVLLDALLFMAKLAGGLAWLAGLIICLRPSLLRGIEKKSNRWLSVRHATKALDVSRTSVDEWVLQHTRATGYVLLLSSLYLLLTIFRLFA